MYLTHQFAKLRLIGPQAVRDGASGLSAMLQDTSGATAVMAGLAFTVILGFAGLATDVASWQVAKSAMHGATDRAAYSGTIALSAGTDVTAEAKAVAAQLGFVDGQNNTTVTINNPPLNGSYQGDAEGVEVIISQPAKQFFSQIWMGSQPTISARSVAAAATGNVCMLATDTNPADIHSILINTGGDLEVGGCTVADNLLNSKNTDSLDDKSNSTFVADTVYLRTASICNGGSCAGTFTVGNVLYNQKAITDPYSARTAPSPGSCSATNEVITSSTTLNPGTYCGTNGNAAISVSASSVSQATNAATAAGGTTLSLKSVTGISVGMVASDATQTGAIASGATVTSISGNSVTISKAVVAPGVANKDTINFASSITVTLNPGVYILDGQGGGTCGGATKPSTCYSGDFDVSGGATVNGTGGVTIVMTTSTATPSNIGNIHIDDSSTLNLTAPTSGTTAGMALWVDDDAPNPGAPGSSYAETDPGVNTIGSGSTASITGAIYMPSQALLFSGGSGGTFCTQMIAYAIQVLHSAKFTYGNCNGSGTLPIGGTPGLVE